MCDRLNAFRKFVQFKLERDIEHVATLTKQARWPDPQLVAQARRELAELNVSITELRAVVAYLNDFEAEEVGVRDRLQPCSARYPAFSLY